MKPRQRSAGRAHSSKDCTGLRGLAASAVRKQWALVRQFAAEFGLTPSARTRVGAPEAKPQQEDEEAEMFGVRTSGSLSAVE